MNVRLLNLGSGVRCSTHPESVNIDWTIYLRIARNPLWRRMAPLVLDEERLERLNELPRNILVHDLRSGIPFPDGSVDAIYHSHVLEHIDRDSAEDFMREIRRVLRPGGYQRIVVPDLELLVQRYLASLQKSQGRDQRIQHNRVVGDLIEQSVRREAAGTASKSDRRRWFENLILGDARRRGETHQWMYDRVNLAALLDRTGFVGAKRQDANTSDIPGWEDLGRGLDLDQDGKEYKDHSLYFEAVRPSSEPAKASKRGNINA